MATDRIKELESQGWKQQFVASGMRLEKSIEDYRLLGFEIKTIPINELGCNDCNVCFDDVNDKSVMIFTRKSESSQLDDLFEND